MMVMRPIGPSRCFAALQQNVGCSGHDGLSKSKRAGKSPPDECLQALLPDLLQQLRPKPKRDINRLTIATD
ncbi:hypothetical protein ABID62_002780 [Bradyrhizobium sp. S3.9.1]